MASTSPLKTDLIIGMTLAEVFLLVLFLVWYSQGPGSGPDWRLVAEKHQARIGELEQELKAKKEEIRRLQMARDWWRKNFGMDPPASEVELIDALGTEKGGEIRRDMARGFPRCDANNVLVEVAIQHGGTELRVQESAPTIRKWAKSINRTIPPVTQALKTPEEIRSFLEVVKNFYNRPDAKPCRYDYRLRYATKEDYYDGREKFEKYFYPAGLIPSTGIR